MKGENHMTKRKKVSSASPQWPRALHALASLGSRTEQVAVKYFIPGGEAILFGKVQEDNLKKIADALRSGWSDEQAAEVLQSYAENLEKDTNLDISTLCRYILCHPDDSRAVLDCVSADPPQGIEIIKVLSRAGSQKLVFLATWDLTRKQVVLKRVIGPKEVTSRERFSSPLSISHPNIIETHFLTNKAGEEFLVEKYIAETLDSEDWFLDGILEAVNLFYDIADALNYIFREHHYAHSDVKPANIAKEGDKYILLDFGIARPVNDFKQDTTATGSLRTRAPELLAAGTYIDPHKSDVWSLGATVFRGLTRRFPLLRPDEPLPTVSEPDQVDKPEQILLDRANDDWDEWVNLGLIGDKPIRDVLDLALKKEPSERGSAQDIKKMIEDCLPSYLRKRSDILRFSPLEEARQLLSYLPDIETLSLLPGSKRKSLREKLSQFTEIPELEQSQKDKLRKLLTALD